LEGRYTEEIAWLKQQLAENSSSILFARLAERYYQIDEIDEAIEVCRTGLETHDKYATAHLILAKCYFARKHYDSAEKELKKVLSSDPKYLMAHKLYGDLMTEIGWTSSVENSYKKILEVDPLDNIVQQSLTDMSETAGLGETVDTSLVEEDSSRLEPLAEPPAEELAIFEDWPVQPPAEKSDIFSAMPSPDAATVESADIDSIRESETEQPRVEEKPPVQSSVQEVEHEPWGGQSLDKSSGLDDEMLLDEEAGELEFNPEDFEIEDEKFSDILDDIFSPELEEEEETQTVLKKAAAETDTDVADEIRDEAFEEPEKYQAVSPLAAEKPEAEAIAEQEAEGEDQEIPPEFENLKEQWDDLGKGRVEEQEDEEPFDARDYQSLQLESELEEEEEDFSNFLSNIELVSEEEPEENGTEVLEESAPAPAEPETLEMEEEAEEEDLEAEESVPPIVAEEPAESEEPEAIVEEPPPVEEAEEPAPPRGEEQKPAALEEKTESDEPILPPFEELDDEEGFDEGPVFPFSPEEDDEPEFEDDLSQPFAGTEETAEEEEPLQKPGIPRPPADEPSESKEKFVTPTLGEIYAAQGQYAKAINVFELLQKKNPDNEWYRSKLEYLRKRLKEQGG
jgi:tetratricopeptide (TPR) repeat protein